MFNRNSLVAALSAVGMLSLSGAALAQQVVVSGGATLPQPLYQDEINSFPASTFKAYVGKGSGAGKTAEASHHERAKNAKPLGMGQGAKGENGLIFIHDGIIQ